MVLGDVDNIQLREGDMEANARVRLVGGEVKAPDVVVCEEFLKVLVNAVLIMIKTKCTIVGCKDVGKNISTSPRRLTVSC